MGFFRRAKIDPALEAELRKRGMAGKVDELNKANEGTSVIGQFPGAFSEKWNAVAEATSSGLGTKLGARAITSHIILQETAEKQAELERRGLDLHMQVAKKLRDPNVPRETKQRMVKLLETTNTDIISQIPELQFTKMQVAGDAASLALLATSGLKLGLSNSASFNMVSGETLQALNQLQKLTATMNATTRVAKYGTAGKVINYVIAKGLPMTKDAVVGAIGFGAAKASSGGTPEEIEKHAKIGAAVGVLLPIAFNAAIKTISGAAHLVGDRVLAPIGDAIQTALERAAAGTDIDDRAASEIIQNNMQGSTVHGQERILDLQGVVDDFTKAGKDVPDYIQSLYDDAVREAKRGADYVQDGLTAKPTLPGGSETERTLTAIGEEDTLTQKVAKTALKGIEQVKKLPQKLMDRFSPISRIQDLAAEAKGGPLSDTEKVYRNFRLTQPAAEGRAEFMLRDFFDDFKQYDDVADQVKARIIKLDLLDRANLGQQVVGGETADTLGAGLQRLVDEAGDNNPRIEAAVESWNKFHFGLLKERLDAGLISQELYDKLITTHPNYMPHNVILDLDEQIAGQFNLGQSMNVANTDIKKAFGSLRKIQDPYVAMVQRTPVATQLIEKNKTLTGLIDLQEAYDIIPGMKQVTGNVADDALTINVFRDGVKETWVVPEDVAVAVKNLDYEPMTTLMKWMTAPNRLLKKFATQYNISFTIPNLLRDRQTAAVTADAFIRAISEQSEYVADGTTYTGDDLYRLWKESGGAFGSVFREGEPPKEVMDSLTGSGFWQKVDDTFNPVKLIDKLNTSIEESTRLMVFERGLSQGLSPKDAAFVAREATVDFAKMGTFMRQLNQVVPFLNARVQGLANVGAAVVANPEHFGRIMTWTAVYPTMVLQSHNRQFESYKNIPQYFKDNYWNIITGEVRTIDEDGNDIVVPQFISIKKGEAQSLVANPVQHFLDKADGLDYRTTTQMITDTIGNASPVNFSTYDHKHPLLSILGSLGPLANIPIGLATNIDPYSGYKVVPESRRTASPKLQYRDTTPDIIKDIAGQMNVSPAQIDFILRSFGGVPTDVTAMAELGYDAQKGRGLDVESVSGTPFGTAANLPLLRRFFREASGDRSPESEYQREKLKEFETEEKDKSLLKRERLQDIYEQMSKLPTAQEREAYLKLQDLSKDDVKSLKQIKRSRQSVEVLTTMTDSDVRAKYILWRIDEMKANGVSLEERYAFLKMLEEQKILTPTVQKLMAQYKAE